MDILVPGKIFTFNLGQFGIDNVKGDILAPGQKDIIKNKRDQLNLSFLKTKITCTNSRHALFVAPGRHKSGKSAFSVVQ